MPPMVPRFMPLQTAGGRRIGGWDRDATPFRTFLAKQTGRRPPVPPPSPATVLPLLMAMQAAGGNQQPVFRPPPPPGQPPRTTLPSGTPVLALPSPGVGTMAAQPRYPAPPPPSPATLLPLLAAMQAAGANQRGGPPPGATTRPAPVVVPPVAAPVAPPTADDVASVLAFVRGSQGQATPVPEAPVMDMSAEERKAAETAGTALQTLQAAQAAYDAAKAQLEANRGDQAARDAFKQAADALTAAQNAYKAANEAHQAVAPEGESVLETVGEAAGDVAGAVGEAAVETVKADLKAVQEGANWLLEHVGQPVTGYAIYQTVLHGDEVLGAIPLPPEAKRHILDLLHDTLPEGEEGITRAYEEGYERPVGYSPGYDPTSVALGASPVETARIPPGGKAVEAYVRDELCASPSTFATLACNYLLDFFEDPLTYAFGAGQVVKGVTAGTKAARAGQVVGGVLQAPDVAVERVVKPVLRGIGDVAQMIRGVRTAIDKAPTTYVRQREDELFSAGEEELSAGTVDIGGTTPTTGAVPGDAPGGAPTTGGVPPEGTPTTPAAPTTTPGVPGRRGTYLDPKEREAAQAVALGQQPRAVTAVDALPPEANAVYDDLIAPANEAHAARQNALTNKDNLDFDPALTRQERDLLVTLNQADYMVYDFYPTFRRAAGPGVPLPPYRYNSGKHAKVPGENATIDWSSDGNLLEHAVFGRTSADEAAKAFATRHPEEAARLARLRKQFVVVRDATDLANLPPPRFAVSVGPLPQAPPSGVAAPSPAAGERVVPPAPAEAAPPVVTVAKQQTGRLGTIPAHYKVEIDGVVDDRFRVRKRAATNDWVVEGRNAQTGDFEALGTPGAWRATVKATPEAVQRRLAAEGATPVPMPESPGVARPSLDVAPTELPTPSGTVPPAGVEGPLPAGATPETLAAPISDPSRRILDTPFREGPYAGATQRQVWDTLTDEARRYTQNAPDARKIRTAWGKDATLLDEAATPREAAFHRLMALAKADEAVFRKVDPNARPGLWTLFHRSTASFLLQSPTRVIPYVLRNIGGNELLVMMAHGKPVETGFLRAAVRVEEAGEAGVIQKVLAAVARKAGVTADSPALADVVASGMGSKTPRQLGSGDKFDIGFDPIVQFIDRLHGGKLRVLGKPNARGAAWANEVEKVEREGLWRQRLREYLATGEVDFVERLATSRGARAAGFDVDRIRAALAPLDVVHAPRGVGQALADAGASRELVQQAMQDWANVARKSWDNAIADVNRPMPLYNERNIDRWAKAIIPFHFWQSRASVFIMESMLRNPAYLANFLRIQESYREATDDPNLPPWMRGMMRIGGTMLGVNWYSNPLTVLLPAIFLRGETPDDVNLTWVGRRRRELREYGAGLWPSLDTTLNVLGVFGPESIQGVLPIAELAVVGKMIDLGLAELDEGMGVPIQQNFYRWLREEVTGFLEGQGVPGVSEIRATDPNAYKRDLVASQIQADHPELVATWLAGENPDATPAEEAAGQAALAELSAMLSPGSPEWNAAWRQVALVGAVDVAVGTVSPLPLIPRQPLRDQTLALTREGRANLEAGAPLTPEQQAAFEQRGMATTPVESPLPGGQPYPLQQFEREVGEYYGLGTDEQKAALDQWGAIAFGDAPPAITVGTGAGAAGQTFSTQAILALPQDMRIELADLDAMTRGTFDDVEALRREREAFVAAHPTFRAYQDWAKQERDKLGDEPGQFADEQAYRDAAGPNPNLSAYYDGIEQRHADDPAGYTAEELERDTFGPDAYLNTLGIKTNIYDPAPLDVRSPEDIPYTPGQERQGTGTAAQGTDPAQRIRDDIADYQQKSLVMDLIVSSLSEGRVTRWADLDPMWQVHLSQFYGDLAPRLSPATQAYVLWAQRQPAGTDTSPEAFLASKDALTQLYVQSALSGQPLSPEMLAQLRGQPGLESYSLPGVGRSLSGLDVGGTPLPPFTAFRATGIPMPNTYGGGGTGVPLPSSFDRGGVPLPSTFGNRGGVPMPRG